VTVSALPKSEEVKVAVAAAQKPKEGSDSSTVLETRQSEEIVIAFMGAVGCGMPNVISKCEDLLTGLGYKVEKIKLSDFIKDQIKTGKITVGPEDDGNRYLTYQTGGNFLRKAHGNEVFAEFAINRIKRHRLSLDTELADLNKPVPRVAYLIDQIKHPEEAKLLRLVYRKLFYLIGVMSTVHHRQSRLIDEGNKEEVVKTIMARDRKESESYGQQLEKAFKFADYFVHNPFGQHDFVKGQLERFLNLIHGHNGITPSKHEYAMYVAHSTALRSGCLSRQVGASIIDPNGKLIAVGANDVPQFGGGLYSAESKKDFRCFKASGKCENVEQKMLRKSRIHQGLIDALPSVFPSAEIQAAVQEQIGKLAEIAYKQSGLPDLIEFSRAVHAEMDAIVSVARSGFGSTQGATLYTTTFPCHNCARHIIAAGMTRVYYIEPYEKSLALTSHSDAIVILDHDDDGKDDKDQANKQTMVEFIHFAGVAPNLYPSLFLRERGRKDDHGNLVSFDLSEDGEHPRKIVKEYLDSYRKFEAKVAGMFEESFPPPEATFAPMKLA